MEATRPSIASSRPSILLSLPLRFGELGIFSHGDCATHAYVASTEASDRYLIKLLALPSLQEMEQLQPQRARCTDMYTEHQTSLISTFQRKQIPTIRG